MIFSKFSPQSLAAVSTHFGSQDFPQRIIVPVDFSSCSNNAIRFAVSVALRTGATLRLVHSLQLPLQASEFATYPINDLESEANHRLAQQSGEIVSFLETHKLPKIEISFVVAVGFASEEIIREANACKADMICMGTHGAGKVAGVLLGSIATAVMNDAHCPLMVIPENAEFTGFKRIAYASDMQEVNRVMIHRMADFAKSFDAELYVLHVLATGDVLTPEQANAFRDQFNKAAHYDKVSFHIVDAEDDTIVATVDDYLDDNQIELLASLTHRKGFFDRLFHPSVTKRFALDAHKPLLVFH